MDKKTMKFRIFPQKSCRNSEKTNFQFSFLDHTSDCCHFWFIIENSYLKTQFYDSKNLQKLIKKSLNHFTNNQQKLKHRLLHQPNLQIP